MSANPVVPNQDPTSVDTVQFPSGHQMSIPSALPQDSKDTIAATAWEHMKGAGSSFLGAFGLPASVDEAKRATAMLPSQIEHPLDTASKIASATGSAIKGMGANSQLIEKARQSWQAGDHGAAVRHMLGYLTPLVGSAGDKAGEELESGEYGRAMGTTLAAIAPLLFGKLGGSPETAAGTAEATPEIGAMHQTVDPEMWGDVTTNAGANQGPKAAARAAKPTDWEDVTAPVKQQPMSESGRQAAAYIRKERLDAGENPHVELLGGVADEPAVNIGGRTVSTGKVAPRAAIDQLDIDDSTRAFIAKLEKQNLPKSEVDILADIKKRLGISKPSPEAIGQSSADELAKNPASAEAVKARALSQYSYAPEEGELSTNHRVSITDAKGKPAGEVTAVSSHDSPNDWQMDKVEATQKQGTGSGAFRELFRAAQKQADSTGEAVTVHSGGVQTPEAANLWESTLKKQGYDVKNGEIRFTPAPKVPAKVPANWADVIRPKSQAVNSRIGQTIKAAQDIPLQQDVDLQDWK